MRQFFVFILCCLQAFNACAQENLQKIASAIRTEATILYRSETASWYGTDLLTQNYKDDLDKIGGYVSYAEDSYEKCIFFSREDSPKVIMTILFDSKLEPGKATYSLMKRAFTPIERELYSLRIITQKEVLKDTSFFETYSNTNYNFIPVVDNGVKKVYILTGTSKNDVVVFGNDYLLTFGNDNKLIDRKKLHRNILPTPYGSKADTAKTVVGSMHTHLPGTSDYMTVTDLCTLMLYAKATGWETYSVVSEKYICIWRKQNNLLLIINR